jgi:hypothetical protein
MPIRYGHVGKGPPLPEFNSIRDTVTDATVAVAGITLLLYLAAASTVRGFVGVFEAQAEWFSPSVFQLICFAQHVILVAAVVAIDFFALMWTRRPDPTLWFLYAISAALSPFLCYTIVQANEYRKEPWYANLLVFLLTAFILATPLLIRWSRHRASRLRAIRARRETARQCAYDLNTQVDVTERPESDPTEAAAGTRVSVGPRSAEAELVTRERARIPLAIVLGVLNVLSILIMSALFGAAMAARTVQSLNPLTAVDAENPSRSVLILFTDGTRTLTLEQVAGRRECIFTNPETSQRVVLRPPGLAALGHQTDAPGRPPLPGNGVPLE